MFEVERLGLFKPLKRRPGFRGVLTTLSKIGNHGALPVNVLLSFSEILIDDDQLGDKYVPVHAVLQARREH